MKMPAIDAIHLLSLSCLLHFLSLTRAQPYIDFSCNTSSNYTSGSVFQKDLKLALTSLAANASLTGYYTTATGQSPDVYGLIQCRGYVSQDTCRTCAKNITSEIIKTCPNQKEAYYFTEECSLQYSDRNFFATSDSSPRKALMNIMQAADPVRFQSQLGYLLENVSYNAAANFSKSASGSMSFAGSQTLYAMVQCTRNLTGNDCLSCLQNIINYIPEYENMINSVGGRIFALSCNFRYETYAFFPLSTPPAFIPSPPPPPPPASTSSPPPTASPPPPVADQPNSTSPDGKSSKTIAIIVTPVAVALIGIPIICGCFYWTKARRKRVGGVNEDGNESMESLLIGLNTLTVATGNFSDANKLGEGGFGPVYKGILRDGREIAVKRLSSHSKQGLEELKTEVMLVAKLQHRNLVKLLGFCLEKEKLLVYEYLPNGSLDKILFDQNRRISLEWSRRYKIIVGIARGLLYLHEDSRLRIVHRDLKASNILLDASMLPKISDFGLARLFSESGTHSNTNRIAGTYGYIAPEYANFGSFSTKSDVYSFGILVLEIVTGSKSSSFQNEVCIQTHAWRHWAKGTAMELLDPTLHDQWTKHEVLKCIHIALLCVQEAPAFRPTMSTIVMMLVNDSFSAPSPSRPAFFFGSEDSAAFRLEKSEKETLRQSINEVTISELNCPR